MCKKGPADYCKVAIKAVNRWWDSFSKEEQDIKLEFRLPVTVYLFGSEDGFFMKYKEVYRKEPPSTIGLAIPREHSHSGDYEIWLRIKRTDSGNYCVDEWAAGHELMHVLDFEWSGRFGNPDQAIEEEFYKDF